MFSSCRLPSITNIRPTLSSIFLSPLCKHQQRSYKVHPSPLPGKHIGRSISAEKLAIPTAYFRLKSVLQESRIREIARYQERFERNHDRKRRKQKQAEWRQYMEHVKSQVTLAKDLSFRTYLERKNYRDI
ncbi:hypothetical protein HDU97_009446 [Phlyctochytrium planicorne]|nr:hypothetical protein HDU97_009446 [Phlyctochytrium planicorne]